MTSNLFSTGLLLTAIGWVVVCAVILFLPPILLGIIRKTKARMQGRAGASILQPVYDLSKLLRKGETIMASGMFRVTSAVNFSIVLLIAFLTPWVSFKPALFITSAPYSSVVTDEVSGTNSSGGASTAAGASKLASSSLPVNSVSINGMYIYNQFERPDESDVPDDQVKKNNEEKDFFGHVTAASDFFLVVYMFALARFFAILTALGSGSAFGGIGASREVTLALLIDPAIILILVSLASAAHTSDLNAIFGWNNSSLLSSTPALWFIAGVGLFLANMVDLSRMPVDDPTSRIELAVVREAIIVENSGRNLALVELTYGLKMIVLLGLTGQCFLHGIACFVDLNIWLRNLFSVLFLVLLAVLIGLLESITVKLRWNKVPEFIAYSLVVSILCAFIAVRVSQ